MARLCWTLATLFAGLFLVMLYLFVIRGSALPAGDGRTTIRMTAGERELVLAEMRSFLVALQAVTAGVVAQDGGSVARAARGVGGVAQHGVPVALIGKLPLAFKRLGFDTHARFDQIALDVEQYGDLSSVLPSMAALLQNCTACHAAYRIELESP